MLMSDILICALLALLVINFIYHYHYYWRWKNLPNLQPYVSNTKIHLGIQLKHFYDVMKEKGWKHGGFYLQLSPVYITADLNYVKNIMIRDFSYFPHRGLYYNEKKDPLSAHIFNTSGTKWKDMRSKLNQIFTATKLKKMFPLLLDCEKSLLKRIDTEWEENKAIDIKKILDIFISDIIECCAFGLDSKIYQDDSIFRQFGRKIFNRSRSRRLKGFLINNFSKLAKNLDITLIPPDASSFFLKTVKDTVIFRENNNLARHDFLQVLIDMKKTSDLTVEEIAAQCFIFFIAGMSTSPAAMTFTLYELARHQDIQNRVRQEIEVVLGRYDDLITYDSLQEMQYLGQVFEEALRMYPPAAYLNRKCEKDYKVPGTEVVVTKGTTVAIPVLGIHYDKEYYPDPESFNPERFNNENKNLRPGYAHIPFGEGPRICIGMRFGLMQSKLGLVSLLKHFRFAVSEKTKQPLRMKPSSLVLSAEGEIWLNVSKI